jgi:hypothetical protein
VLAELADQLLEQFGLKLCLARLVTGTRDCHGGAVEIGSDIPLQEIGKGDEREAILSRRRVAALIWVGSMRSLLDTENQEVEGRGEGEGRVPNELSIQKSPSGPKFGQIRRPFHPDVQRRAQKRLQCAKCNDL